MATMLAERARRHYFFSMFSRFYRSTKKNDGSLPTPCIVDRSERAGTLDAMLTSPKPVSRLLRQSCSDWLLRQAADLRACAATSLLQPSRLLNSHPTSWPSRMVAVCSSAASSEALVIRIDSAAIGMLVGRRIQASDCTYCLTRAAAKRDDAKPLAARDRSTATFARAECTRRPSRVRGNASTRAAM